jgi:hypothetical protein
MKRFAASALCAAMMALVAGVASVRAAVAVPDAVQRLDPAASQPAAKPSPQQPAKAVRKPGKAKSALQARKPRKAVHAASHHVKARAKHHSARRVSKVAKRKLNRPLALSAPLHFSPPAAGQPMSSDRLQAWPAKVVIGATVTAFSSQGDVGSAHGIDNCERAQVRFHGGPEVSCQLMLVPRNREIPPGSTGSALLSCQGAFQVLKDEPTFSLYQGGRLVGEGNLSVLAVD